MRTEPEGAAAASTSPRSPRTLDAAADAIIVVDRQGFIVMASPRCESMFGQRPADLLGRHLEVLIPERFHASHAGRRDGFFGDPVVRPMGIGMELHAVRKDGTEFPVEISLSPLETEQGILVSAAVRDVTERLRERGLFEALLEASPDATVIVDEAARIVLANNQVESVFGYEDGELVGQKVEVLVPERFRASHAGHRDGFLGDPVVRPMGIGRDLYAVRKDGTEFPVELSLSPLETEQGVLVSAAVRDISERNRLKEETYRLREELIATVSHELRTPLTSIIGYTELMQDLKDDEVNAAARRLLAVIARNAHRELRLVDDLLAVAFLEGNQLSVALAPVDLAQVAREGVDAAQGVALSRGVSVEMHPAQVAPVCGDAHRLGQVVDNLLTNAVKFTQSGGNVDVRVRDEEGMALLEVADDGAGMTPEDLERIFDRLYRSTDAIHGEVPGIGLGLSIVQEIVSSHGGTVDVESNLGGGTVVRVRLPYASVPA